ncbi:MAG: anaerobic magnesium-protoporphyrin monomethyl ester cyclase [Thermococcaceae archaeon]|nr:radical SAM protein [Thermococcus bergensis]MCA6213201.1 B12-binding domain-containing radical SAM protein [Thermococcus bergensis]MDK2853970.1 anaerobic magnesium-protoporphyrin monomethyl ester cyclase [Thermococcaceae archaeon]
MTDSLPWVMLATKYAKSITPEKIIILGGPGPSEVCYNLLSTYDSVDIVCIGEGEYTLLELMRTIGNGISYTPRDLLNIKGIAFKHGDRVIVTPKRERIQDLDALPFPAYHLINLKKYYQVTVDTSRGCPFRCTFCDVAPLWGRKVIYKGVSRVIEELKLLNENYGVKNIHFTDDTFTLNKQRVLSITEQIQKSDLDIQYACFGRVNLVDNNVLTSLMDSGCKGIFYGIESGSNRILRLINKGFTIGKAIEVVINSLDYIKNVTASFIWGYPFEDFEDFLKTFYAITYLDYFGVQTRFSRLAPLPMSELRKKYENDIIKPLYFNIYSHTILSTQDLPQEIVEEILKHPPIYVSFYWFNTPNLQEKLNFIDNYYKLMG